jgi:crotonobetainyl-CoA:carnitine CoA-transferase CaiB-like acyl-CoA transferase
MSALPFATRSAHNDRADVAAPSGPLAGVRVLDITTVVMGPMAVELLGDLGAEVIKIEEASGDLLRSLGGGPHRELSGMSLNLLRNRRSVVCDLSTADGRDHVLALARDADVVVTNLRPKSLANLGLRYEDVRAVAPAIVFCQAAGYPTDSERADRPAFDDVIQAEAGVADALGRIDGLARFAPTILADKVCALLLSNAIAAALYHRATSGEGQHIELAMTEAVQWFLLQEHLADAATVPPTGRPGYARLMAANRKPHRTADGWIAALPYSNQNWLDLFAEAGRAELLDDERFATVRGRVANADHVYGVLGDIMATRTTAAWLEFFKANNIPGGPVTTMDELVEALPTAVHPVVGEYRVLPNPLRFSATPSSLHRHAPMLGEHTDEVRAAGWGPHRSA